MSSFYSFLYMGYHMTNCGREKLAVPENSVSVPDCQNPARPPQIDGDSFGTKREISPAPTKLVNWYIPIHGHEDNSKYIFFP
jgi:hypothetical protein